MTFSKKKRVKKGKKGRPKKEETVVIRVPKRLKGRILKLVGKRK